jgi:ADP-heptose:LPS heptosyltransferase
MSRRPVLLALRALGLGDLLVAVPALRALGRAFPGHRRLLATPAWLHPLLPLIGGWDEPVAVAGLDVPLPEDLPPISVAVNLHGKGPESSTVLDALRPSRRIGHRGQGWPGPKWRDELPERVRWCRLLAAHRIPADPSDLGLRRPPPSTAPGAVLVHPGAAYGAKRWPAPRFAAVAAALAEAGHQVLVTGSAGESERAREITRRARLPAGSVIAGRTGLVDLASLVAEARLVISGDTGIAHLAVAFGTPSITVYGPADPHHWGPPPGPHRVLHDPSRRRGDPFADDPDPALLAVTVSDVLAAGAELGALSVAA